MVLDHARGSFVARKIDVCGKEDSILWQGRGAFPPWEHEASLGQTWCLCRGNLALVAYSFFGDDTQKRPRPHMIFRIAFVQRPRSHVRCCETGTIHLPYTSHTPPIAPKLKGAQNLKKTALLQFGWNRNADGFCEVYVTSMVRVWEVSNET